MTIEQLKEKVISELNIIESIEDTIVKAALHAMESEEAKKEFLEPARDTYALPIEVLSAVFSALALHFLPNDRKGKRDVKKIRPFVKLFADIRLANYQ